jgi:hypothetical protein
VANRKKTKKKRKPSRPLPKVGSAKDNAYRLEHSRKDVVDFGLADSKRGPWNAVIIIGVLVLLGLGALALILFT